MKLNLSALLFALGVYLVWFLPWLLPMGLLFPAIPLALYGLQRKALLPLSLFLVGLCWGILQSWQLASNQLPASQAASEALVIGRVASISQNRGNSQRFEFLIDEFTLLSGEAPASGPEKILLSWYQLEQRVSPGDIYQFEVRLRRPRGLSNFAQFDYRRWLLAQGIHARGYVREAKYLDTARRLSDNIDYFRLQQRAAIDDQGYSYARLISALGLGLKEDIRPEDWQLFLQTGVIHLMVISGLHIGFAALLGFKLCSFASKPFLVLGWLSNQTRVAWIGSLLFAACYAALAGWSLPTVRALLMLSVLALSRIFNINWSGWTVFSLALALVAVLQPLAVMQDSFWLSFGAVAVLIVALSGRPGTGYLAAMLRTQWMLLPGFGGILLCLGKPLYLSGFFANLLAVPLTGFVLVPLILLALFLMPVSQSFSHIILTGADAMLGLLVRYLHWIAEFPLPPIYPFFASALIPALLCFCGALYISVPARGVRLCLAFVLLPLLFGVREKRPEFELLVFDVGQGAALLIEQPGYRLLYDTGPAFGENFNAASDILLPHLEKRAVAVNDLIISHDDNDHAGGFSALRQEMVIDRVIVGGEQSFARAEGLQRDFCQAGQAWRQGRVSYSFLYPEEFDPGVSSNNQSCVLLIEFAGQKILLAGDIETSIERQLLSQYPDLGELTLLLVPHHGSGTSSSEPFVAKMQPQMAIISSGYGNSFGHPRDEVVQRYRRSEAEIFSTASHGAWRFSWFDLDGSPETESSRSKYWLWWQE